MNRDEKHILDALVSRRRRISCGASASATPAALAGGSPAPLWAQSEKPKPTADTIILLWMAGGMAQTETFDPNDGLPEFQTGLAAKGMSEHSSGPSTRLSIISRFPKDWSASRG